MIIMKKLHLFDLLFHLIPKEPNDSTHFELVLRYCLFQLRSGGGVQSSAEGEGELFVILGRCNSHDSPPFK